MPFRCEWKVPGTLLYAEVGPTLTLEEVGLLSREVARHITEEGQPPIYFFVDMTPLRNAPGQLSQLRRVAGNAEAAHVGCYFIIVSNPIFGFVAAAFVKLLHRPVRVVATYADAVACLHEFDPELAASLRV